MEKGTAFLTFAFKKMPFFDSLAEDYDAQFTETAVGKMQREQVWLLIQKWLPVEKNARILELNCGTGRDARWLAELGFSNILATDLSEKMLAVAARNIEKAGLGQAVRFEKTALESIADGAFEGQKFDFIFSDFGGINCVSPAILAQIGSKITDLLPEGGRLAIVAMGRFCLFESLYFLAKRNFKSAFRRLCGGPVAARLDAQTACPTWYFSPRELAVFFKKLERVDLRAVGFFLPPSYLDPFFVRRKKGLARLALFEKKWAAPNRWMSHFADHFLIVFQKNESAASTKTE